MSLSKYAAITHKQQQSKKYILIALDVDLGIMVGISPI